jgi:hypothetical protein
MRAEGLNEADIVQNAALGAALIWRFCQGYQERSTNVPPLLPFAFIVLPICLYSQTIDAVLSTRRNSGLALFAAKVGEMRETLLAIHTRARDLRELSLQSISLGVRSGILAIDYTSAAVRSNTVKGPALPERIKPYWNAADRLGYWCGGVHLMELGSLLRVEF